MRPTQWVKNTVVFGPLVFAQELSRLEALLRTAVVFGCFCMLAGAIYLLNDIADVEADRRHPIKRHRPIASGDLPIPVARRAAFSMIPFALTAVLIVSAKAALAMLGYLLLNVLYSSALKKLPYLDVVSIALGFELRVLTGAYAARVPPSGYLVAVIFLAAMFLGLGKRMHELGLANGGRETRKVLQLYHLGLLRWLVWIFGLATFLTYLIYTLDPATVQRFRTPHLIWSAIPVAAGMLRFVFLVNSKERPESPTDAMLHDPLFIASIGGWVGVVLFVLYIR
ncbi:MAG: UbiA prenyltransferase family protein [Sandaracinaceae bacterium]|nr:UbiA prenyltransferase family protein [Sandaracinaceae bacterium]